MSKQDLVAPKKSFLFLIIRHTFIQQDALISNNVFTGKNCVVMISAVEEEVLTLLESK